MYINIIYNMVTHERRKAVFGIIYVIVVVREETQCGEQTLRKHRCYNYWCVDLLTLHIDTHLIILSLIIQ